MGQPVQQNLQSSIAENAQQDGAEVKPAALPTIPWQHLPIDTRYDGSFLDNDTTSGNFDIETARKVREAGLLGQQLGLRPTFGQNFNTVYRSSPGDATTHSAEAEANAQRYNRTTIAQQKQVQSGQVQSGQNVPANGAYWDGRGGWWNSSGQKLDGAGKPVSDTPGLTPEQMKQRGITAFRGAANGATFVDAQGRGYTANPAQVEATWSPELRQQAAELDQRIAGLGEQMKADPNNADIGRQWLQARQQRGAMSGKIYSGKVQDPAAARTRDAAGVQAQQANQAHNQNVDKLQASAAPGQDVRKMPGYQATAAPLQEANKTLQGAIKGAKPSAGAAPIGGADPKLGSAVDWMWKFAGVPVKSAVPPKQPVAAQPKPAAKQPIKAGQRVATGAKKAPAPQPAAAPAAAPANPFQPVIDMVMGLFSQKANNAAPANGEAQQPVQSQQTIAARAQSPMYAANYQDPYRSQAVNQVMSTPGAGYSTASSAVRNAQ